MSINPGATISPVASITSASESLLPSTATVPPTINKSPTSSRRLAGSMMRPLRIVVAFIREGECGLPARSSSASLPRTSIGTPRSRPSHIPGCSREDPGYCGLEARAPQIELDTLGPCSRRYPSAEIKNRHAHGETVGHLIEDDALRPISEIAIDLDPPVDRTGMHDQAIGLQQFGSSFR